MRAGRVLGQRVVIDLHVGDDVRLELSSPAGHHIATAPLSQREAIGLRDSIAEAIDLVGNPRLRRDAD